MIKNNLRCFFKSLIDIIKFNNLPDDQRSILFYSEGQNHWPYLSSLVIISLQKLNKVICYVTSDINDKGLTLNHKNLKKFYVGNGGTKNYFFNSLKIDKVVMTMPDLDNYQIKKSKNCKQYIYVQHSLVSLHMAYRNKAFDNFDIFCCAGPHHRREIKAIEKKYNLKQKKIVNLGYPRLDYLNNIKKNNKSLIKKILIAPSWGKNGLIESGLCVKLVEDLLNLKYHVILRPHPESFKHCPERIKEINDKNLSNKSFQLEKNIINSKNLACSDLLITDWSGIALELFFAFKKPIIYCDIQKKINNSNYVDIPFIPIEISLRGKIGTIWDLKQPIDKIINRCQKKRLANHTNYINKYVYNIGTSDQMFIKYLKKDFENE